jgi:nitroreductase
LKEANLESYRRGVEPHPEVPVGDIKGVAPSLKGVYRDRQVELAVQIFQLLGIGKEDKAGQEAYNEQMVQFYDAPAVIILVADKVLGGSWPIMDMGFVSQNITLAALEAGLGTCVMRAIVDYPEKVREIVGIPDSKRIIVGIAIGYPDWDHPINAMETRRENIEKLVVRVE